MSKAFVPERDAEDEEDSLEIPSIPVGAKNYLTPAGYAQLQTELTHLVKIERPEVVSIVSWAAGNGDRSENGDYIYGKKRLREIDRRIRFLGKRLENAVVVDPCEREETERVFFGATVTVLDEHGGQATYSIVGIDEADPNRGRISWISPLARALLKSEAGDCVRFQSPGGWRELEILAVEYRTLD